MPGIWPFLEQEGTKSSTAGIINFDKQDTKLMICFIIYFKQASTEICKKNGPCAKPGENLKFRGYLL